MKKYFFVNWAQFLCYNDIKFRSFVAICLFFFSEEIEPATHNFKAIIEGETHLDCPQDIQWVAPSIWVGRVSKTHLFCLVKHEIWLPYLLAFLVDLVWVGPWRNLLQIKNQEQKLAQEPVASVSPTYTLPKVIAIFPDGVVDNSKPVQHWEEALDKYDIKDINT